MLSKEWDERLRLYITAIVQNHGHKMLAINNMPDHVHFFVGLNPVQAISDLLRNVKSESSEWINKEKLLHGKFQWQEGYGAFSHSKSQVSAVISYIHNQQVHHEQTSFLDEYKKILNDFGIEYDDRYVFSLPV